MRWLLSKDGQVVGPVEQSVIQLWQRQGTIQPGTFICREGDDRWIPFERSVFAEAPQAKSKAGLMLLALVPVGVLGLCGISALLGRDAETKAAKSETVTPVSETKATPLTIKCTLSIPGSNGRVPLFPTESGFEEWGAASARGDTAGAEAAARADGYFMVERGTTCSPIDPGILRSHVRVLEGPHAGKAGWIPSEWRRGD
jgi:hypothetical protein